MSKKEKWEPELRIGSPAGIRPGKYVAEAVYLKDVEGDWRIILKVKEVSLKSDNCTVQVLPKFTFSSPGSWLQFLWLRDKVITVAVNEIHGPYIKEIAHPPWDEVKARYAREERT